MRAAAIPGIAVLGTILVISCSTEEAGPLSPADALDSFQVAPGFRIELFASEPHVVDPVEMAFDEHGGAYVAELLDNPDDPPEGTPPLSRIKYIEDTDGDGVADRHTVFADRLLAVEGIAPWKGGLIATAAPDILFLKDTDGDRRADVRETLYTGFALAHVEGRLSNPRLGLDNWFYVVNHGYPGEVRSVRRPEDPAVSVRNREFRFHPLRGLAEASTGDAQFGQDYNQWGHWFIAHNTVHLRHTVVPPGYLDRNPLLSVEDTAQDISDHGRPDATVFPISRPQRWRVERTEARQRRYDATRPGRVEKLEGHFTAAAGTTVYVGDAFPGRFHGSVFVGEGNGNLVHCDFMIPSGPTYTASRWPADSDFLASTDNWFRPVNFSNAPDGNLYVIDYYRQYLEHPMFIPDAVKKRLRMDFRAGTTLGRIYRVVPENGSARQESSPPGNATADQLVGMLDHPNGWHRRTAHRLLLERQDRAVAAQLRELAVGHASAGVRLRALWVLEGLGELPAGLVEAALDDLHPAVRESALRLAERFGDRFSGRILAATRDSDARVAFQATLSAGSLPFSDAAVAAMAGVLARFPDDRWLRIAVLSAPPGLAAPIFARLLDAHPEYFGDPSPARKEYVRSVAGIVGAMRTPGEIARWLGIWAGGLGAEEAAWQVPALQGLAAGLALHSDRRMSAVSAEDALGKLIDDRSVAVSAAAAEVGRFLDIGERLQEAGEAALDPAVPLARRVLSARLLQSGEFGQVAGVLESLLGSKGPPELQLAAARSLASFDDPRAVAAVLAAWHGSPAAVRDGMAESLTRRRDHALALVRAVEDGRVAPEDIPAVTRIRLAQHPDAEVSRIASTVLDGGQRERDEVVAEFLPALELRGSAPSGEEVFERECAKCHLARAARGRIGPDLSGVSNRSKEDLLTSILDPSYAIEDRYRNHILFTKDGRLFDGILVAETSLTVTLRAETGNVTVLKADIDELRPSGISLMPEGFEDSLSQRDVADVIAFLRAGL